MSMLEHLEFAARLGAAIVCGAGIGWERESRGKSAGLKTHTMVALGSCLFTLAALGYFISTKDPALQLDPTRLIQGIAGGLGFLGAGCIIQNRDNIKGLTTAATIWVCGAIGVACGVGNYVLAFLGLASTLLVAITFQFLEKRGIGQPKRVNDGPDDGSRQST